MNTHAWSAMIIAVVGATAAGQNTSPRPAPVTMIVQDVMLIDGTGTAPRAHVSLTIRDGKIAAITDTPASPPAPADLVVDGRGLFAIPGLFDAHVHLSPSRWDQRIEQLRRVLQGGVTSLYDVAGDARQTSDFARAALAHDIESPSIDYCTLMAGPSFFTDPRVVGSSLGYRPGEAPWNREISSAASDGDIVRAVAAAKGTGASAIKLYAALDAPTVRRIADEAHRQGMRIVAHSTVFPAKPSDLVAARVNMVAHAAYLVWEGHPPSSDFSKRALGDFERVKSDSPEIERLLASMRDARVALNPTLSVFTDGPASRDSLGPARIAWMNAVTHRAAELGVTIVAGTDGLIAPNEPPALHRELELLVAGARLTPMQALVSATRDAARTIGVEDVRGTIEVGKAADVVLLSANPLDDIRNSAKIATVVKNGRVVFGAQPKSAQLAVAEPRGTGVVLLGTGTPLPNPNASGPATAITVGERTFLVDAGAGVTRRMVAAGFPRTTDVAALFLTHLHTDHTLGYPDLIFSSWVMGRTRPIEAYGPRGLKRMTAHLLAAWSQDIDVRINGLEREQKTYGVNVHEIKNGVVYDRDGVRVTAIPVSHGSWKEAFGFRFDTPGRSVVISGDTRPSEALVDAARGCDVLIHEVYTPNGALPEQRPGGEFWPQYMKQFHTSALELGALAVRIQPKLLVLHHVIMPETTEAELIGDIRKGGFNGRVVIGKDLEKY